MAKKRAAVRPRVRRLERRARAVAWRLLRGVDVGRGAAVGRGCRLFRDSGARIVLGEGCEVDDGTTLAAYGGGTIVLGSHSFVGHHATIAAHERVEIGPGAYLAELVSIRDHDHRPGVPPRLGEVEVAPVVIGEDVWIAAKATVLRGCSIGEGTVVGANAVASGDLPPRSLAVGVPARVIRTFPPDEA